MAGTYPDVPSRRFAYDEDGSILFHQGLEQWLQGDLPVVPPVNEVSLANLQALNSENNTVTNVLNSDDGPNYGLVSAKNWSIGVLLFPELREIDGIFGASGGDAAGGGRGGGEVWTSGTATSPISGSWTSQLSWPWTDDTEVTPITNYRSASYLKSMAVSNVKAVRFSARDDAAGGKVWFRAMHLYGVISPLQTPDRILYLDPDNSDAEFGKPIDYGDVPSDATIAEIIKLKNNSGSYIANGVQIEADALYESSDAWYTFSLDDVDFSASLAVGSLGSGQTKTIYVRQTIPAAEATGLHAARFKTTVTSWT